MYRSVCSFLILLLSLMGCSKPPAYRPTKQELRFNLRSEPPTLDPRRAIDTTSIAIISLCFEGLTHIGKSEEPTLAIAKSVEESEDKTQYIFHLKETFWSDGHPLTAWDFEKTWKKILDPSFSSEFAMNLFFIKGARAAKTGKGSLDAVGVKALDDRTLQIDLDYPVPYLLSALAAFSFYPTPTHIIEKDPSWLENNYVSNGPFLLKENRPHEKLLLEKNPNYWDADVVRLTQVSFAYIPDESTELTMFENNELDWAGSPLSSLPVAALPSLNKEDRVEYYNIAGTYCYVFNTQKFPFTNVNIRKALALAINREEIVKNVTLMNQRVATGLVPPSLWEEPKSYFQDHNIEEAKRYFAKGLQELKLTKENFPTIHLSYNTLSGHHTIAQAIQQQWYRLFGIQVTLSNKEWKVFLDELHSGQFEVARLGGIAHVEDPTTFLDDFRYLRTGQNVSKWHHPTYTALLEEAERCPDEKKRLALLQQAETLLIKEMPVIPIYFYTGAYLKKPYVKDALISELNLLDLKWAYVETDE